MSGLVQDDQGIANNTGYLKQSLNLNLNQALGVYTGFYGAPRQYSLTARYDF